MLYQVLKTNTIRHGGRDRIEEEVVVANFNVLLLA